VADTFTLVSGATFCIGDELGDLAGAETSGLWDHDTRFLSLLRLTVSGERPLPLASRVVEPNRSVSYLRNAAGPGLDRDTLLISRERVLGEGMEDVLTVQNESEEAVSFELVIELEAGFAGVIAVKER
jgi:hypothetical protein